MDILFGSRRDEKLFSDFKALTRKFGARSAKKITNRLAMLRYAGTLGDLRGGLGRLHELKGDRKGQLALDITGNMRLVLEPAHEPVPTKDDGGLDWTQITAVRILEVVDYHG